MAVNNQQSVSTKPAKKSFLSGLFAPKTKTAPTVDKNKVDFVGASNAAAVQQRRAETLKAIQAIQAKLDMIIKNKQLTSVQADQLIGQLRQEMQQQQARLKEQADTEKNLSGQVAPQPSTVVKPEEKPALNQAPATAPKIVSGGHRNDMMADLKGWQTDSVARVNLIKEQAFIFVDWREKFLWLALWMMIAALAVVAAYGGLLAIQKDKLAQNSQAYSNYLKMSAQIDEQQPLVNQIILFDKKLALAGYLLDNHTYWTQFFKMLENYTLKNVYYQSFAGQIGAVGTAYTLPAVARNCSYVSLQTAWLATAPGVSAPTGNNCQNLSNTSTAATAERNSFSFNLGFSIDPMVIFLKK